MTREEYEALLVRVVDDIATPAEREALMAYVADKPPLRQELEAHHALKAVTDGWVERLELDLAEDRHRSASLTRFELGLGWLLLGIGTALLLGFGSVEFLLDPEVPVWVRAGMGALSSGGLLLLFSAIRWRWSTYAHDKYTEVIR